MQIGIGLPTWCGNLVTGAEVLDWARRSEDAGFHAVAVHDRPASDTWDPLATLAAVAAITHQVRLMTTALLLPTRDEASIAKQALVIDRISDGRFELGVAVGARHPDFHLFGRSIAGRGGRFQQQLEHVLELWGEAEKTAASGAGPGPSSVQRPHPPLWIGGYAEAAPHRAVRIGDGYLFGAAGAAAMRQRIPAIRETARAAGRPSFPIAGLAYVVPNENPAVLVEAEWLISRYYGTPLRRPFDELVHHGASTHLTEQISAYRDAGIDILHLFPVTRDPEAVDILADHVVAALA